MKGAVLDKEQLEKYLKQLASDQIVKNKSNKDTYPIPRMKENFEVITEVYRILNEHIKLNIPIHAAGEWLLDNYYAIEETVKSIEKELSLKKYINFVGIANGTYEGFARVYVLASEIVAYTDAKIDSVNLKDLLKAYQEKKTLSMEEIWNIGMFLQVALIENIRNICEKIYSSQIQKYKVENMIERIIENKNKEELKFKNVNIYKVKEIEHNQMKYPFIEYMSYKLRTYGKKAYPFLNVLEEQVHKMGTEISEVIEKEHFDIALKKISIGNSITSIKTLSRINFTDIFEQINQVENILKQDPANVYEKMDYKTKAHYRNKIKEISKKTKISEIYIAKKCLELAQKNKKEEIDFKEAHIGYYLIAEGETELLNILQNKRKRRLTNNQKMNRYSLGNTIITFIITIGTILEIEKQIHNWGFAILAGILVYIPIETLVIQVMQYVLGKTVKSKIIPKLDYQNGIPKEEATFVVIPTILKSKEKVQELMDKLEIYYLANKSENLYFALLGDASCSKQEIETFDKEVQEEGIRLIKKLNEKYPDENFPKFHFITRKRIWNEKEESYLGWERKRGLLNQFNEYLLGHIKTPFQINSLEEVKEKIPAIKYIITLDADTELSLNAGLELIGAMSHILNLPILNEEKNKVISGYGIMQPRVGISLEAAKKTKFTRIYAGTGGTDPYANAISDIYQDNFEEGVFTGKGIYNLSVFSEVLKGKIPENTVLSHDLLEGSYLRCGLITDVMLMDGYPSSYQSFKTRLHRWIRGDWQIIRWLKGNILDEQGNKRKNSLGHIDKYKIRNNLVRSIQEPLILILIGYCLLLNIFFSLKIGYLMTIIFLCLLAPMIIQILDKIIYRKEGETYQKTFTKQISRIKAGIISGLISIGTLPDKAYMSLNAIIKTIYRMKVSKKHLLEWTTAEEAEKSAKNDLKSYYISMIANVILGILALITIIYIQGTIERIFIGILGIWWLITPSISWYISKPEKTKTAIEKMTSQEKEYILEVGKRTWQYFKDNLNEKGNYLPPDNYQENRNDKVAYRTSPTNIGLGMLSVVSSYDLGYENLENTINLLEKMLETIEKLPKWRGHLYNWYQTETLQPLTPRYISTVDSGNFIGYLYVIKQFLEDVHKNSIEIVEDGETEKQKEEKIADKTNNMLRIVNNIIDQTNFSFLYHPEKRIFSIGFNVEDNELTPSYYDLLASEARQASYIAIAKKDVPSKHWFNLSRTLTTLNRYKGLISWSGTAFEYLMPTINMPQEEGSLLDESMKFAIMSQREYAKRLHIPWGISEAAFSLKDLNNNYQYKAFGIPWLGVKRGLADELVVSSYGSILAINELPKEVIKNLKELEKLGMYDKYGFYESIDYTPNKMQTGKDYEVVKTYMAHHQGLILNSINNLFNTNLLQTRFMKNPEIKAVDILLQERMPEKIIITKEQKEKVQKIKNLDYGIYTQREISKIGDKLKEINVISNNEYTIIMDQKGNGYSKYKGKLINRFKETDDEQQGIYFYFKNIKTKRIWTANQMDYLGKADKYVIQFAPELDKTIRKDGNIETTMKVAIMPNDPVEVRQVELKNEGNTEETIEITSFFEPVLSEPNQDYAHKAFNNLFLSFEWIEENNSLLIKRKARNKNEKDMYLAVNLYTEENCMGELEYEIEKERFVGRGNLGLPKAVENSMPFAKKVGLTTDPIIAMKRTIQLMPNQKAKFNLILSVAEEKQIALERIQEYFSSEKIERNMELARAKVEAETMYLGMKGKQIETCQKMLRYLLFQNPLKTTMGKMPENMPTTELWKYGISGDLPILLVKIREITDIDVLRQAIQAYAYFNVKNVAIDLVILNEEKKTYDNYVSDEIQNAILDKGLGYKQNVPGGIYVLNHIEKESKKILEGRANLTIDAHLGNIDRQLKDREEEYLENRKELPDEPPITRYPEIEKIRQELPKEELKYYNEYGGFSNDGKEYQIRINKEERLPTVWSHVLANEKFGTIVTENLGGYTWYKNSKLNRLTAWSNSQITDVPSEIIYCKEEETQKIWSLGLNPIPDDNDYYITYGFGYARYEHTSCNIKQKLDIFVPQKDSCKVQLLHLENLQAKKKEIKLVYYVKPVLGEDELKSNGFLKLKYDKNTNMVTMQNTAAEIPNNIAYITSSQKITSYTGNKNSFLGKGNIADPDGLKKLELDKQGSLGQEAILAIEMKISLEAWERKDISIVLGAEEEMIACQDMAYKYSNLNNVKNELEAQCKYWRDITQTLQVNTPLESMNIMLNGWLTYQTICARLWARSGYYQSGGAFGFRDQLQDGIGIKYFAPELLKKQIIKHSQHQFVEGDVEHWWHEETQRGIRTKFSDDLLWLPYIVCEYINLTGDSSLLEEIVPYRAGPILENGIDEKYDLYPIANETGSIYEHCIKAIEKGINLGEHGIPKIGAGDWNDGFSTVGNQGKGESIWLGFFLYTVLDRFIPICQERGEEERAEKYKKIQEELKRALNTAGWDGRWYKRAYMDNGEQLGSIQNEECRIDSIAQSWATISKAGDNDKKYISMESLENHLVDKENGIIKLLDPPLEKSKLEPGYIKAYLPGTRENGGQYTHGAIWAIIAETLLGFGDKAVEYFRMINPIEHSRTKEEATKYKVEPYVIAADIYGAGNLKGRGGWTWYTGSSSWFYEAGIRYILGLTIEKGILSMNPCIPSNWKEYTIRYKYGESIYHIKVTNPNAKNTGVEKFTINGEEIQDKKINLIKTGGIYNIEVQI